jgi:DNA-binding sugar fermentation-stimulating protein
MIGQFILQILGITKGRILSRPSVKLSKENISDVLILKDNTYILTHTPSYGCTGLANSGGDVFVAPCPPDVDGEGDEMSMVTENGETFTHTIFLSEFTEKPDNHQIIGINPKIAIELMESILEKNLISCLPGVKEIKRNVSMFLEGKVDSSFSFVGICDDDVPFVMEVSNVPFAEYKTEDLPAIKAMKDRQRERIMRAIEIAMASEDTLIPQSSGDEEDDSFYNLKTSYFPEVNHKCVSPELIKRINEMANIAKESSVRCILGYVVQRTDIHQFEISSHNKEYYNAVANAVASGVFIVPVIVSWTAEGVSFFVTDQLPVVQPTI